TDPLALLFPGGSLADTEKLYRDSPPAQAYNGLIAGIVAALAQAAPSGRPLRLLEIGAGTGSTTAHVLPRLAGRAIEYTFTDVSPLFLNRARERFAGQEGMRYELLDIGHAPAEQGFPAAHYDLILGANVVHATPDLQRSLENLRGLLAPGGLLVLLEGTLPQRFGDVTVGLLEGWWAYADTQRRNYALMARPQWLDLLAQCGFDGARALPGENDHPVWSQQAIFVAQVPRAEVRMPQRWLLRPDTGGVAEALAAALRARGDGAEWLPAAGVAPEIVATALAGALRAGSPAAALVDLTALDTVLAEDTDGAALMDGQRDLLGGALALVQTLAAQGGQDLPALWWVTRGAQAVLPGESAHPAQASLWGMSHVVAIEHPELRCHRVDLDPAAAAEPSAASLLAELDLAAREDQLALRGARRLARRLVSSAPRRESGAGVSLREDRSYLVTGGLHGLGLRVARWLADRGARHLRLMGRRAPDALAAAEIDALRARGIDVQVVQGDVADAVAVQRAVAEAVPALAGVVHSAGALDDGVLASLNWQRFENVLAAKVRGSWNLHRLAGDLDFLVLFSSGASVGGSAGQANHAAANAFEDALAWYRQAAGLPTLSINWGPWAEIGAAADRKLTQPGLLDLIAPADGLAALEHLLRREPGSPFPSAQVAVLA
ncbi:MAG: SDR family NAD(P)-dependent oxidoreductase, partial [Rhodocyclaceae bacterium]